MHLLYRELDILRVCDHPNIAKFYECYESKEEAHFVLEYCSGDTLFDSIYQRRYIPEEEVKMIMFQLLMVVNHLHSRGICHRDLKPENFLFSCKDPEKAELKMIDFGLSKSFVKEDLTTFVGTSFYVAPEVLQR